MWDRGDARMIWAIGFTLVGIIAIIVRALTEEPYTPLPPPFPPPFYAEMTINYYSNRFVDGVIDLDEFEEHLDVILRGETDPRSSFYGLPR
jgi:hypothetical protein